jgi:hypothetical protein
LALDSPTAVGMAWTTIGLLIEVSLPTKETPAFGMGAGRMNLSLVIPTTLFLTYCEMACDPKWLFMSFMPSAVLFSLPLFLAFLLGGIVLKFGLQLIFKAVHLPNYTSASPSGLLTWTKLAPSDIVFRLASLAALNVVLYWLPVYYWTTYTPCGDDRDGMVLIYSDAFCPVSWILGGLCYAQIWRRNQEVASRYRLPFQFGSTLLLLIILSTVVPQIRTEVEFYQFSRQFPELNIH